MGLSTLVYPFSSLASFMSSMVSWTYKPLCAIFITGFVWHASQIWTRKFLVMDMVKSTNKYGGLAAVFIQQELSEVVAWAVRAFFDKHQKELSSLINHGKGSVSILDVGCGPGNSLVPLFEAVDEINAPPSGDTMCLNPRQVFRPEIHAVDWSESMLEFLKDNFGTQKLNERNVTLHEADASCLPFNDGTFEIAVVFNMLHMVKGIHKPLTEVRRTLRSGGMILVAFFDQHTLLRQSYIQAGISLGIFKLHSKKNIMAAMKSVGFGSLTEQSKTYTDDSSTSTYILITGVRI